MKWKPIKTMPSEETVLVHLLGGMVIQDYRREETVDKYVNCFKTRRRPTHWVPMPTFEENE